MNRIYRSHPSYHKSKLDRYPVIKGAIIGFCCLGLIAVGYFLGALYINF